MSEAIPFRPEYNTSKRLAQLERSLTAADVVELQSSRSKVAEFIELGRRWSSTGLFRVSPQLSRDTGREVVIMLPEAYLAMLVNEQKQLGELRDAVEVNLPKDPKTVLRTLGNRAVKAWNDHSQNGQKTIRLADERLLDEIDASQDPTGTMLNMPPAPTTQLPPWFAVIDNQQMGPLDLENFYAAIDSGTWKGARPDSVGTTDVRAAINEKLST